MNFNVEPEGICADAGEVTTAKSSTTSITGRFLAHRPRPFPITVVLHKVE